MDITRRQVLRGAGEAGILGAGMAVAAPSESASAYGMPPPRSVTCLGDSISDTHYFNDEAYPFWLARYLAPARVMADGVAGNGVADILARCQRDGIHTASQVHKPGSVTFVLAGVNDILFGHLSASRITAGLRRVYRYLGSHGSTVYPVTILPCAKAPWYPPGGEDVRHAVNRWILRHPHAVNADVTMSDGGNPPALRGAFDNGDGVHPWHIVGPQMLAMTCVLALV